ncbi:hypothetical protein FIU93_01235 [Labrenzia sp. THAF35]|nr:hypothetical protein FIU93_01235 [Labrenzia sp. THAF35]
MRRRFEAGRQAPHINPNRRKSAEGIGLSARSCRGALQQMEGGAERSIDFLPESVASKNWHGSCYRLIDLARACARRCSGRAVKEMSKRLGRIACSFH